MQGRDPGAFSISGMRLGWDGWDVCADMWLGWVAASVGRAVAGMRVLRFGGFFEGLSGVVCSVGMWLPEGRRDGLMMGAIAACGLGSVALGWGVGNVGCGELGVFFLGVG